MMFILLCVIYDLTLAVSLVVTMGAEHGWNFAGFEEGPFWGLLLLFLWGALPAFVYGTIVVSCGSQLASFRRTICRSVFVSVSLWGVGMGAFLYFAASNIMEALRTLGPLLPSCVVAGLAGGYFMIHFSKKIAVDWYGQRES